MCYNMHKGRSFFTRRIVSHNIQNIIHKYNPEMVFLQEVRDYHRMDYKKYESNQLDLLSKSQYHTAYGKNAIYKNGHHGNGLLTKYPILETMNFDISVNKLEQRSILYSKLEIEGKELYTFCTHLNLRKNDRKKQITLMEKVIEECVPNKDCSIILLGDFNDFDGGIKNHFVKENYLNQYGAHTYPNFFPFVSPDLIFTKNVQVNKSNIIKDKGTLLLSDHLPILMEIEF